MTRYIGIVSKVNAARNYAFIKRTSVTDVAGEVASLDTTKDIFVHQDECPVPLVEGLKLSFAIARDSKRPGAFRATDVRQAAPNKLGIDLHIDDTHIDNPSVPMRWCLSREAYAHYTEGLRAGKGYAMLLVARRLDDDRGFYETREVIDVFPSMNIVTFKKPGAWSVCLLLIERERDEDDADATHSLKQHLRSHWLDTAYGDDRLFEHSLSAFVDLKGMERISRWNSDRLIALCEVQVIVPSEVFAPEPSEAAKEFGNYFFRRSPGDECVLRRRLLIMTIGFGFVPYLVIELFKRVKTFLFSILALLFAVKGSFSLLLHTLTPAVRFDDCFQTFLEDEQFGPWDTEYGLFYTPGAFVIYGVAGWVFAGFIFPLVFSVVRSVFAFIASYPVPFIAVALVVGVFVAFKLKIILGIRAFRRLSEEGRAQYYADQNRKELERAARIAAEAEERALENGKMRALRAERHASALVCGDAPAEVSLKALPKEFQTVRLKFLTIKRAVCRPFG